MVESEGFVMMINRLNNFQELELTNLLFLEYVYLIIFSFKSTLVCETPLLVDFHLFKFRNIGVLQLFPKADGFKK